MKKWIFDSLPSTNDVAAQLASRGEDAVVVARSQTNGRGRKGRSFESSEGGLYCSILRLYTDFAATRAFEIMRQGCLAVVDVLAEYGIRAQIKWPNDVMVNGKKICGILIETSLSGSCVSHAVIGIGLNVNNSFSGELKDIALSMSQITHKTYDIEEVLDRLLVAMEKPFTEHDYRAALCTLGKRVHVEGADGGFAAQCVDVAADGRLAVVCGDKTVLVSAGDVTVREDKA